MGLGSAEYNKYDRKKARKICRQTENINRKNAKKYRRKNTK